MEVCQQHFKYKIVHLQELESALLAAQHQQIHFTISIHNIRLRNKPTTSICQGMTSNKLPSEVLTVKYYHQKKLLDVCMSRLFILNHLTQNGTILYDAPPPMVLKLSTVTAMNVEVAPIYWSRCNSFVFTCWSTLASLDDVNMFQHLKHVLSVSIYNSTSSRE